MTSRESGKRIDVSQSSVLRHPTPGVGETGLIVFPVKRRFSNAIQSNNRQNLGWDRPSEEQSPIAIVRGRRSARNALNR